MKKTDSIENLSLPQIIKQTTKREAQFEELDRYNRQRVMEFIHRNNIDINVIKNSGFDIIKSCFFVNAYLYDEDTPQHYVLKTILFTSFDSYYRYLKGDIYNHSCFYGYAFTADEIKRYSIVIDNINFDSYIDYDITHKSLDYLYEEHETGSQVSVRRGTEIRNWFSNLKDIDSYDALIRAYSAFETKFGWATATDTFFPLLLNKSSFFLRDCLIDYVKHNGTSLRISIATILFYYGAKYTSIR